MKNETLLKARDKQSFMAYLSIALLLIIVLLLAAHFFEIKNTHRRHE